MLINKINKNVYYWSEFRQRLFIKTIKKQEQEKKMIDIIKKNKKLIIDLLKKNDKELDNILKSHYKIDKSNSNTLKTKNTFLKTRL